MKKHPLADPVAFFTSPEVQAFFDKNVLKPILARVVSYLYPYILALTLLWVLMFLCIVIILIILLRVRV